VGDEDKGTGEDTGLALPEEETREERRRRLLAGVVPLSQAIHDYKPIEWLIERIAPKGCLIILAGEPKRARKTLLTMGLSLDVAEGEEFLGQQVQKGLVFFGNLEDGYHRSVRRYYQFGVRAGPLAPENLHLLRHQGRLDYILEYIREFKPALCVLDPVVELELQTGVESENDAKEVARMLKLLRDVAQETGTVIIAVHHYNKSGDIRGSTAFRGSADGWWEIIYRRNKPRILRWTLRDGPEGEVDIDIQFDDDMVTVRAISEFRDEHSSGGGGRSNSGGSSNNGGGWSDRKLAVSESIRRLLESTDEAISRNEIARRVSSSRRTVTEILKQFEEDGVAKEVGDGWVYCPSTPELL